MKDWDKTTVIEWFKAQKGEEIVLRMRGGALRVQGQARGVEQLDACSTEIAEARMALGPQELEMSLSFHADTLAVHLISFRPGTREVTLSLPVSIPYAALLLDTAAELARQGKPAAEKEEEPEFSPYELLHRNAR